MWGEWMFLDNRGIVEAYPVFADSVGSEALLGAPRLMLLTRTPTGLEGTVHRRFEQRGDLCEARAAVRIGACGDALEVTIADPPQPVAMSPCRWSVPPIPRTEHWSSGR
jgi:hypothetical protein